MKDFKTFSEHALTIGLIFLSTVGAMKGMDSEIFGNDEEAGIEAFNSGIKEWIAQNPDRAETLAKEIVAMIEEFKSLQ